MEAPEFIKKIDWELLKKQKQDMITVMSILDGGSELEQSLEGILSLIDATQDYAVDELGIDENIVFNLNDEDDNNCEVEIIGYQVLDENNDIHPDMDSSLCVYSHNRAIGMLANDTESKYHLVPICEGEIKNPTFMFKRD